jgi:hypothetical protein
MPHSLIWDLRRNKDTAAQAIREVILDHILSSDLREAQTKGHIHKAPHFNSISNYLADPNLTETFSRLVTLSSLPLKGIENNFAVDSSGFSTCRFVR